MKIAYYFNSLSCQYEEHGEEFVDMLDGMFSFVLLDTRDKSFIAARDAIGITPLYLGWGHDGMWLLILVVVMLCIFISILMVSQPLKLSYLLFNLS